MTTDSKQDAPIGLPQEIREALLKGYEVNIKATKKEGSEDLFAKITFHKVKVAGTELLKSKMP